MKTRTITFLAATTLWPITNFAQTPSTPPLPPAPPIPPGHNEQHDHERAPKVPVTFLGLETSPVPSVVCDQLGIAKGFGLVVDYVVPNGPAAAAGVQQNDILKMLNDQILMEPNQLAKLVRSFSEGTNVTLTVLRKGAETKLTAKLAKREVPGHRDFFGPEFEKERKANGDFGFNSEDLREHLQEMKEQMKEQLANAHVSESIREAVRQAREQAAQARENARQLARGFQVVSREDGEMKSTKIDLGKAEIVFSDGQGELKIDHATGKKVLTAKDPLGRLLFSGPVETKEEIDKIPAGVKERYEKLEERDLPTAGVKATIQKDKDENDDVDEDDDDDSETHGSATAPMMQQASLSNFSRQTQDAAAILF